MNEQTTKLIEELATKLGTTAEYLWGVLIKQAFYEASITLVQILCIFLFCLIFYKVHKRLSKIKEYNGYKETGYDYYGESAIIPMIFGAIILGLMVIIAFFSIDTVINGFFNPEYWALEQVLDKL